MFLIVGMVVMDRVFSRKIDVPGSASLQVKKKKQNSNNWHLNVDFFFAENTKAGKMGSHISCTVFQVDKVSSPG